MTNSLISLKLFSFFRNETISLSLDFKGKYPFNTLATKGEENACALLHLSTF